MARVIRKSSPATQRILKSIAEIDKLNKADLQVGFFESAKYEDGTPVAGVAAVHELGSPKNNIPPRPFMRTTSEAKKPEWAKLMKQAAQAIVKRSETADSALNKLGLKAAGDVRETISTIQEPKLKESTVKRKGSDKPLVESGIMINSVTHRVKK